MPDTLERDTVDALERRARQAQALVDVSRDIRYDQPLSDVLASLAANIVQHTRASSVAATLLDPGDLSSIAYGEANVPAGYTDAMIALRQEPREAAQIRRAVAEGRTWVLRDARNSLLSRPAYAPMADMIRQVTWETVVGTAFEYRPEAMAVVYLCYDADVDVDDEEVSFARAIAYQTAPAMDTAWLFSEAQRRTAELEALHRADEAMHHSLRLDDVLQAMVDLAVELLGADKSLVSIVEGGRQVIRASRGMREGHVEALNAMYQTWDSERYTNGYVPTVELVEDVQTDTRVDQRVRDMQPASSYADLPIFIGGELFGFFIIGFELPRTFTTDDHRLFDTLAARAGLAFQNALLFEASTAQARQLDSKVGQLEALRRADAALHRSLRLQDVYEAMVDLAMDLAGADRSLLIAWNEDERLHAYAARGVGESELARLNDIYHKAGKDVFEGRIPQILVMEDVPNDRRMNPEVRAITPSRSTVDIPVVVNGELFGLFVISWTRPHVFTDDDQKLFEALATRTAMAIQNALLYEQIAAQAVELEAQIRQLEALRAIAANLTLDPAGSSVYDELAKQVVHATSALACAVIVLDEEGQPGARMLGTAGLPPGFAPAMNDAYLLGAGASGDDGISAARPAILPEGRHTTLADDRFARAREIVADADWEMLVSRPLIYQERRLGMLVAGYPAGWNVDADEISFLAAIADQGAVAVANARLMEASSRLATAEERQRLARELHDSVSQALYGIALGARTARRRLADTGDPLVVEAVEYVLALAEAGLTETRALIFELIPESLANEGLAVAVKRQAAAIQARHQIPVHIDLGDEPNLPLKTKEAIYRIAQESLNNLAKHAKAENAYVTLTSVDGLVRLEVRDDGAGFDPAGDFPGHLGLVSMRERARRIGATYAIESSPGKGATVTLTVPAG
jgi:signal transduction histidine kinase